MSACFSNCRRIPQWMRRGRTCLIPHRCVAECYRPPLLTSIEAPQHAPIITGYLPDGFSINSNVIRGSVALLPRGFFGWKVRRVEDITPESFTLFFLLQPRLELVLLGTGSTVHKMDPEIARFLKKKGINFEVQDSPNACATFNYLLDEGRPAGAVLIPAEGSF